MKKLACAAFSLSTVHFQTLSKIFFVSSSSARACLVQIVLQLHARPQFRTCSEGSVGICSNKQIITEFNQSNKKNVGFFDTPSSIPADSVKKSFQFKELANWHEECISIVQARFR